MREFRGGLCPPVLKSPPRRAFPEEVRMQGQRLHRNLDGFEAVVCGIMMVVMAIVLLAVITPMTP